MALVCAGVFCFLAYGLAAGSPEDRAACALMMGFVALAGAPAAALALLRMRWSRRGGALAGRAWQVWQAGSWCARCGQAILPMPWAGREIVVPAAAVRTAVGEIAAGRLPALAGYR
ncbi:hypothetical protein [Micromonospora aurantiaca (nom. illeg.)]|uniref:hypothetical protein n=1 Tax=Micromonospora aurantiaca (nom. illeg.) TaxID=47850 RepID=UPI0033FD5C32